MNTAVRLLSSPVASLRKREGQPWLQGVSRNAVHDILGDQNARHFEQKYLGDTPSGLAKPAGGLEAQQAFDQNIAQMSGGQPAAAAAAPMMQPGQMQGGMSTQPGIGMTDDEAAKAAQMWMQLFNIQG